MSLSGIYLRTALELILVDQEPSKDKALFPQYTEEVEYRINTISSLSYQSPP